MPRLDGVDISAAQTISDSTLIPPLRFMMIQVGASWEGNRALGVKRTNSKLASQVAVARARGFPVIWYIVFVGANGGTLDAQLDHWLGVIAAVGGFGPHDGMMFDNEYKEARSHGRPAMNAAMDRARSLIGRATVLDYDYVDGLKQSPSWTVKWCPYWGSNPGSESMRALMMDRFAVVGPGGWQWAGDTGRCPGFSGNVDCNEIIDQAAFNAATGGDMALDYRTKAEWGGKPPLWDAGDQPTNAEYVVIHHVGADHNPAALDTVGETDQYMRNLQSYAQRPKDQGGKGYSDIDYNIGVSPLGDAYEMRGWYEKSGATLDLNHKSYSVLVIGGYTHNKLTVKQRQRVADVIVDGIARGRLRTGVKIIGHRDNPAHPGATSCPGDAAYAEIPWIRTEVARQLAIIDNPPPPPEEEDMTADQAAQLDAIFKAFAPGAPQQNPDTRAWYMIANTHQVALPALDGAIAALAEQVAELAAKVDALEPGSGTPVVFPNYGPLPAA